MGNLVLAGATSGSTTITPTDGVTATLTLPSSTGAIASYNSTFGFKNRIINGAMVIDQRNAGASVTVTNAGLFSVDRWETYGSPSSKFSAQQNAGSVTPPVGFTNYLGCTSLSAYTLGATDQELIDQPIEGLNVYDLAWGTANAQPITISFWVRSSLTGTFGGSVQNNAANRCYPYSYTISSANTWEYKTITIAGDTTGTWLTTNGVGLRLYISLGTGSTYSATAGVWNSTSYITSVTGAVSVVGTSGATFYITGVQLEVGTQATSFDFRDYGRELILCQRYYETNFSGVAVPSVNYYGYVTYGLGTQTLFGGSSTNQQIYGQVYFCVVKRATPTISIYGYASNTLTSCSGGWSGNDLGAGTGTLNTAAKDGFSLYNSTGSNVTSNGYGVIFNFAASAEL